MITISSLGEAGTKYYKVIGSFGNMIPSTYHLTSEMYWNPTSGFANESLIDTIDTPPPTGFSTGWLYARYGIGNEKNCFHTTISGNVSATLTETSSISSFFRRYTDHYGYDTFSHCNQDGIAAAPGVLYTYRGNSLTTKKVGALGSYGFTKGISSAEFDASTHHVKWTMTGDLRNYATVCEKARFIDGLKHITVASYSYVNGYVYRDTVIASYNYSISVYDYDGSVTHNSGVTSIYWYILSMYDVTMSTYNTSDIFYLKSQIAQVLNTTLFQLSVDLPRVSFYECVKDAVSSISSLDMNNIENSTQLSELRKLLPVIGTIKDIKRHPLKAASGLYLWKKYMVDTSVQDISLIIESLNTIMNDIIEGTPSEITRYGTDYSANKIAGQLVTCRKNAKVRVQPLVRTSDEQLMHKLSALGMEPGFANAWDLIPFSFVIDWFTGVSSFLDDIDYNLITRNRFNLISCLVSIKGSLSLELGKFKGMDLGNAAMTFYYRRADRTFPQSEFNFGSSSPTKHILDGLALVIANW